MSSAATQTPPPTVPAGRDLTLDLARVACVLLVVFVHILFAGVGRDSKGGLLIERTIEAQPWFDTASWVANIMPLFFVVGGYAAIAGWRSTTARGGRPETFIRTRLARVARPSLPLFVFLTAALGIARLMGLDASLIDTIAVGVGSPLWFLAAYMVVQALAPHMIALHDRYREWVPLCLLGLALTTDALRYELFEGHLGIGSVPPSGYGFGQELLGIPNIAFVWLLAHQLGFFLYDGWFTARRWWQLALIIVGGYLALWGLVSMGGYSWNMLGNQWPPTATMAALAVVQASALALLRRPLTALMRTRPAQGIALFVGTRLMTIYLWHLPVIMILTGIELLLPLPMPAPGSALWWWTRPIFFAGVLTVVWALSLWLRRFESAPPQDDTPRTPGMAATAIAVLLYITPIIGITTYGLDLTLAVLALVCAAGALWLTGSTRGSRSAT